MINKFKDFLKKFSRKRDEDFSDQEEFSEEISDDTLQDEVISEEHTGETPLPEEFKPSWKDKFKSLIPTFRKKEGHEEEAHSEDEDVAEEGILNEEDFTGETLLPEKKTLLKRQFSVLKKKFASG